MSGIVRRGMEDTAAVKGVRGAEPPTPQPKEGLARFMAAMTFMFSVVEGLVAEITKKAELEIKMVTEYNVAQGNIQFPPGDSNREARELATQRMNQLEARKQQSQDRSRATSSQLNTVNGSLLSGAGDLQNALGLQQRISQGVMNRS